MNLLQFYVVQIFFGGGHSHVSSVTTFKDRGPNQQKLYLHIDVYVHFFIFIFSIQLAVYG